MTICQNNISCAQEKSLERLVIYASSSLAQGYDAIPVDPRYGNDAAPTELQKVTLNFGAIHSLFIPVPWDADNSASRSVRKFIKTRNSATRLDDPKVDFEVDTPVPISSQQAEQLKNVMREKQLTREQIYSLKNLPHTIIKNTDSNNKTGATVQEIKGKKVLLVERSEHHKGYCPIPGTTILIDCVRGVAYILTDTNKVQTVSFNEEILNDNK